LLGSILSDSRLVIGRRDVASLSREKTIVLALLIQLFVAAFSSFLVVGLTSLYDPSSVDSGGVEVGVAGSESKAVAIAAAEHSGIRTIRFASETTAERAFGDGQVDVLLLANDVNGKTIVETKVPEGSVRTTIFVTQTKRLLESLERNERQLRAEYIDSPLVQLPQKIDASQYYGFTYTILLPLLLFLPPFISGSITIDVITEEIERGTLELLRVAPVTLLEIIDGKALTMILLAPLQAVLWLVLMQFNGIDVTNHWYLLLLVTAFASIVVTIGMLLGLLLGDRRRAQLFYSIGVIGVFAATVALPEHPATTVAKLAVDSDTQLTRLLVVGYVALAVALYLAARYGVSRIDPEGL
jgi:ABC-type Na+ efflux pump permease subunit